MKDLASSYSITRDLWLNSKPVVWVFFLISSMTAIDRIFLSFHSPHSLEAAAYMGSFHIFLILPLVSIASIVEAFAARYDGSGEKQKISEAVWQMVFFGIFSILPIFLLIALIQSKGWKLFCGDEIAYLSTSLFFSPLWIILSTISAFFIGTKRGKLVQIAGLIANAVNLILDPILIFGVGSIVPELGCQGAALATGLAICVELALLSKVFFNTSNRNRYKTDWIIFNKAKFMEILRVGLPYGGLVMVQFGGWALYFFLIDLYAKNSLFLISILQSFMLFFSFLAWGLRKELQYAPVA